MSNQNVLFLVHFSACIIFCVLGIILEGYQTLGPSGY